MISIIQSDLPCELIVVDNIRQRLTLIMEIVSKAGAVGD